MRATELWNVWARGQGIGDDSGDLAHAKAAGVYLEGYEPKVDYRTRVPRPALGEGSAVLFTFGQSNGGNSANTGYRASEAVRVFNFFDSCFYPAACPLQARPTAAGL